MRLRLDPRSCSRWAPYEVAEAQLDGNRREGQSLGFGGGTV